jgi:membrane protein YqaA with SNARE-associated domain
MEPWFDLFMLGISALIAATVFPAQSELVLVALQHKGGHHPLTLLAVATCGNVLGSMVNYALGNGCTRLQHHRWFLLSPASLARASKTYNHYGVWTLLFAWLPIIGDALTFIAGMARTPLPLFVMLVTLGKAGRYAVLLGVFMAL